MLTEILAKASLFEFLQQVDQDIADAAQEKGCPFCAGVLDVANYPRKPRGGPPDLKEEALVRFSFCCRVDGCRRRITPTSTRFFGASVYFSAVIVLMSAMMGDMSSTSCSKLSATYGINRRTLKRWRILFTSVFPTRPHWKLITARFMPPLDPSNYILSMMTRLGIGEANLSNDGLSRLLLLMVPLAHKNYGV